MSNKVSIHTLFVLEIITLRDIPVSPRDKDHLGVQVVHHLYLDGGILKEEHVSESMV